MQAKAELARFIGARSRDVVPVVNATSAAATIVNSLPLGPGDFLLCTNMTYAAVCWHSHRSCMLRNHAPCCAVCVVTAAARLVCGCAAWSKPMFK